MWVDTLLFFFKQYSLTKFQLVSNLLSHSIHNLIKSFFVVGNVLSLASFLKDNTFLNCGIVHLLYSSFFNSNKLFLCFTSSHFIICFWCFNIIFLWTTISFKVIFSSANYFLLLCFFIIYFLSKMFPIFQPI